MQRTCTDCVSSNFPCSWCVGANRCTHETGEMNCRGDVLINGRLVIGPSLRNGPDSCPQINQLTGKLMSFFYFLKFIFF